MIGIQHIVVAMKPTDGNFSENALKYGVSGINIDGCRIETVDKVSNHSRSSVSAESKGKYGDSCEQETHQTEGQALGRFPPNVILEEKEEIVEGFPESNRTKCRHSVSMPYDGFRGGSSFKQKQKTCYDFGDKGSAARFFKQVKG